MISQLMKVLNDKSKPLSLDGLSNELGMEKSALEGMLNLLVRKGKLSYSDLGGVPEDGTCVGVCKACGQAGSCPFAGKMPKVYEKVRE